MYAGAVAPFHSVTRKRFKNKRFALQINMQSTLVCCGISYSNSTVVVEFYRNSETFILRNTVLSVTKGTYSNRLSNTVHLRPVVIDTILYWTGLYPNNCNCIIVVTQTKKNILICCFSELDIQLLLLQTLLLNEKGTRTCLVHKIRRSSTRASILLHTPWHAKNIIPV